MNCAQSLFQRLEALSIEEIAILATLRKIPRSGKLVRIHKYLLPLPKRSVFDHIDSLPSQAQFLLSLSKIDLDFERLVHLLVFHDLSEALIGDSPSFTHFQLAQETYMPPEAKEEAERQANERLLRAFPEDLQRAFQDYLQVVSEKQSLIYKFFHMVDKTDPIIAIWRYLHLFRKEISIEAFLEAMTDFFQFPDAERSCLDETTLSLVRHLQNKENAVSYYHEPCDYFTFHFGLEAGKALQDLIEGRKMHFIEN